MRQNNLTKLLLIVAYCVLMFGSCWATVQSLHRTLPEIPEVLLWIGAVAFFTISSWGLKLVVDSFDRSRRVENRGAKLVGGILILIAFWLCFSFPTNTHTFIYMTNIKTVLADELFSTQNELKMIEQTQKADQKIQAEVEAYQAKVNTALEKYKAEVLSTSNSGRGKEAAKFYQQLDEALGPGEDLNYNLRPRSKKTYDLEAHNREVSIMVWSIVKKKIIEIAAKYDLLKDEKAQKEVKALNQYLAAVSEKIKEKSSHNEPTSKTILTLKQAKRKIFEYNALFQQLTADAPATPTTSLKGEKKKEALKPKKEVKAPKEEVKASKDSEEEIITNVEKFGSVVNVWKGIFQGEYQAKGLLFFALFSLLIDIAGYILFFKAFKEESEY